MHFHTSKRVNSQTPVSTGTFDTRPDALEALMDQVNEWRQSTDGRVTDLNASTNHSVVQGYDPSTDGEVHFFSWACSAEDNR